METLKIEEGSSKLQELRDLMNKYNYDAYIIPHSDRHDVINSFKNIKNLYRMSTLQNLMKE
jgi:hypothetical protein